MNVTKIEAVNSIEPQKKKVAAYCRVSTDNEDQQESLTAQKEHYESWIKAHSDWEYVDLYYDSGISGVKADTRDGLQRMLQDCALGKIDYILTKSISRFARNTVDCLEIVRDLRNKNIYIYFEKEKVDTGNMEGELMLSLLSSFAEEESVSISENTKWAIRKRFQNGTFKASYVPYGYSKDENGEMVIEKTEAEVVRWIFDMAISGQSTHAIAKTLHEHHIPTRKGGQWNSTTIRDMLGNEKYIGDALFQKTYTDSRFRRHDNDGQLDKTLVQEHHEAIISRDVFEAVNKLIQQRAVEKGVVCGTDKYQIRYSFSGKIICGECGGTFKRRIHDRGSEIAWTCKTHIEDIHRCSMKYVRDDALKAAFSTLLNKLIFAGKRILMPYLSSLRVNSKLENESVLAELEAELEKAAADRDILRKLRAQNIITCDMFNKELNCLNKKSAELREQISRFSYTDLTQAEKIAETEKLLKFTESSEFLTEFSDDLFDAFAERIIIYDRHNIGFQLKCGLTLKEVIE